MQIKKFRKDLKLPFKKHKEDVGLDIFMPDSFELKVLETKALGLGWGVNVPIGYSAMLVPRSSAAKRGLVMQTSIIDPGYTGEIHLIVTNCSPDIIKIEKDERVCSLVIYKVLKDEDLVVVDEFPVSARGNGGLGSTGK